MATYESFLKLKGSLGDLVFYNLNGKNVVRKKSGFNKNAFKKSPTYEKVRQNSSEFGHCSKIGKIIRQCLEIYIKECDDPLLYQKFARLMTELKDLDRISEKGKRNVRNGIHTEQGKQMLKNFRFGNFEKLHSEASVSLGLWDNSLILDKNIVFDEIFIKTLKVDFENYLAETFEEKIEVEKPQAEYIFEKHFSDDDIVLYFVALKKEDQILRIGFV